MLTHTKGITVGCSFCFCWEFHFGLGYPGGCCLLKNANKQQIPRICPFSHINNAVNNVRRTTISCNNSRNYLEPSNRVSVYVSFVRPMINVWQLFICVKIWKKLVIIMCHKFLDLPDFLRKWLLKFTEPIQKSNESLGGGKGTGEMKCD